MANKVIIHNYVNPDPSVTHITLYLDDKMFKLYPGEPFEVESDSNNRRLDNPDFYAHHIIAQYGPIYGIVEVPVQRTRSGSVYDIESAIQTADANLLLNRHRHINNWASDQMQSRVRHNLPVFPPTGFVEESIKNLNIDLQAKFGFRPVGWDWRPDTSRPVDGAVAILPTSDSTKVAVMEENAFLKSRLERLEAALGLDAAEPPTPADPSAAKAPTRKR